MRHSLSSSRPLSSGNPDHDGHDRSELAAGNPVERWPGIERRRLLTRGLNRRLAEDAAPGLRGYVVDDTTALRRQLTLVVVGYTLVSLPIFYVHHYWNWHMPSVLVLVYAFAPLLVPVVGWLWQHRRRERPPQLSVNAVLRPGLGVE